MRNQKFIAVRIDEKLIPQLDVLSKEYGFKRNDMLNILIRTGIAVLSDNKAKYAIMAIMDKLFNNAMI